MGIAHEAAKIAGHALSSIHAGADKLASRKLEVTRSGAIATLDVTSPDFADGEALPLWATADGEGRPPSLRWTSAPPGTRSIAVVCEDPDAPFPQPFVHRLVYGIPASSAQLDGAPSATVREGKNSKLETGYTAAAPPVGHGLHHYHFQVFALDREIDLPAGSGREVLLAAMKGHVIGFGETLGTYERN